MLDVNATVLIYTIIKVVNTHLFHYVNKNELKYFIFMVFNTFFKKYDAKFSIHTNKHLWYNAQIK